MGGIAARDPRRSPLSDNHIQRITVDWLIPDNITDMQILLFMRQARVAVLPRDTFYGFKAMVCDKGILLLELGVSATTHHY